ncbi:MAG: ChbG/HpnK family deacetylase [Deferribacteres bacterium]|nr:ChbG/HpnK family deacetylase [candidate division KSB1 bacterium]MCB9502577.1 ChbG/HpnK family deacetylase [Deferribacteres bacterium]
MRKYVSISLFCLICFADFLTAQNQPSLLIRCDDIGMNHSVNMAIEQVLQTGMPVSASVMFACPWYQEAVAILKKYDNASVGIHLTLNAEWKFYRWGPVAGINKVPSLVDSLGYFYPTRASLFAARPSPAEVEIELRAQIERAVNSGVKIDYLDYHMGAAVQTEELRQIVEKLADEYQLGIAQYFGEKYSSVTYRAAIDAKTDSLVERVENLQPGEMSLQVIHIGLDTPEMRTLIDVNEFGPKDMSKQRAGELAALLSDDFQRALKKKQVRLVTYRDLIKEIGLKQMSRPVFTY